jgi:hypothetical protein
MSAPADNQRNKRHTTDTGDDDIPIEVDILNEIFDAAKLADRAKAVIHDVYIKQLAQFMSKPVQRAN